MKEFQYNAKIYPVQLERKKVKNVNLRVRSDGVILISAPPSVSEAYIHECLMKHAPKFSAAIDRIQESISQKYADGAQLPYLGRTLRICCIAAPCRTVLSGDTLRLFARNAEETEFAVKRWYADECLNLCKKLNPEIIKAFREAGYSVPAARIEIKEMTSRWGSCTADRGRISINVKLMQYPEGCIRSVFYHEYAHFIHQDHSKEFYAVVRRMMPDYDHWDRILKGKGD